MLDYEERNTNLVLLMGLCSRIARQWLLGTEYNPLQEHGVITTLKLNPISLGNYLEKCQSKLDDIQQLVDEITR